jgi:hypothetical protein
VQRDPRVIGRVAHDRVCVSAEFAHVRCAGFVRINGGDTVSDAFIVTRCQLFALASTAMPRVTRAGAALMRQYRR